MRAYPVLLLPVALLACSGNNVDTTGDATSTGDTGEATADSTGATGTGVPTSTSTETGAPPTTGTTDMPTTEPLTGTSTGTVSDTSTDTSDTDTSTTDVAETTDTSDTTGTTGAVDTSDTSDTSDTTASTGPVGACTPGATQPCYSGPPNTEDVGLCAAGEQQCAPQGEWGACVGEVVPAADSCDAPGDESCDGVDPCGGAVEHQWDHVFGGAGLDAGMRVAFDGAGNLVLAARATGDVDLGGGVLAGKGLSDVVLGKFAPDGEHLWSKRFGDAAEQFDDGYDLTVDAAGAVVLTGNFAGKVDFGGGPLDAQGMSTLFLAKFSPAGAHVWSKSFATDQRVAPYGLACDKDGDIVVGGRFLTSVDLGGGSLTSAGSADAFVGKFDADGKHVWSQRFGDAQHQAIYGLVVDAAGDVYIAGTFAGAIALGQAVLPSAGGEDMFLARLDADGTAVWAKRFGDAGGQAVFGLAIDAAGRLLLTGEMQGKVDFGGGVLDAPQYVSAIAQFDGAGAHKWSRKISSGSAWASSVAYDGVGQILLTGSYSGTADFGGGNFVAQGFDDIFALKLDGAGKHLWSASFGDFKSQAGLDVAAASNGTFAITGQFEGGVNFGGGPATSKGNYDGFVAVFGP